MARIEPPNLAAWMLEHLIPAAERDEAVAGDLEEHFRAGRSDAWYWRQAGAAIATGWAQYLARRRVMIVFALLWSMLAPVWYVTVNDVEAAHNFDRAWQLLGPLWLPFVLIGWTGLHAAFLWAGLMVYQFVHAMMGRPIPRKEIRRAFWIVSLVLPLVYGITFVISFIFTALYGDSVTGLQHAKLAATLLGQIADLGVSADLVRIPYFVALLAALWGTTHRFAPHSALADAVQASDSAKPAPPAIGRFLTFVVIAGIVNALISGFLLCRLPDAHAPTLSSLLLRAACYVALGAVAGIAGAWIYWNHPASPFRDTAPVNFRLFVLLCAAGWIWMPALIIFSEQATAITAFIAAIAAFALAAGLRTVPLDFAPARPSAPPWRDTQSDLFADAFLRPQFDGVGLIVALAIYLGGVTIADRSYMTASLLLALAGFLIGWLRTVQRREPAPHGFVRATLRLAIFVLPAVLLTTWALLTGVAHRNRVAAEAAAEAADGAPKATRKAASSAAHGLGGYESVILWPYPEKKQIVAPLPLQSSLLAPGTTRPFTIQFDGMYWYLQPPDQRPGPDTHQAHGSPLGIRIASNNSLPLIMEARQRLATPIPLARCGQIDVDIENREQRVSVIGLALILEDSTASPHEQIVVGRQRIVSGDPDQAALQTFHFKLPPPSRFRRFDGITLMLLPEMQSASQGPRIAIRELRLYPR
ncbi:MAG TPA: hypothetical protein VG267_05255 [Terracidiphilus sp.]|jgi:hypothetical protein|nr:hypothetical protein [Terracidiphilus sp.]